MKSFCFLISLLTLVTACATPSPHPLADTEAELTSVLVTLPLDSSRNPWEQASQRPYVGHTDWEVSLQQLNQVKQLSQRLGMLEREHWPIESLGLYCVVYAVPKQNLDRVIAQLRKRSDVVTAEPLQHYQLLGQDSTSSGSGSASDSASKPWSQKRYSVNDPYFEMQYGDQAESVDRFHQLSQGKDVKLALVDGYVDLDHPDLRGQKIQQRSYLSSEQQVSKAHGTALAGILVGRRNNGLGIVGLAPQARLYSYAACGKTRGSEGCTSLALVQALEQALQDQVDIVNLSLAGPYDPLLHRLLQHADQRGIAIVAARHPQLESGGFPAELSFVQAVGGELSDTLWLASTECFSLKAGGGYRYFYGNSVAAASVAGVLALIKHSEPLSHPVASLKAVSGRDCDALETGFGKDFLSQLHGSLCQAKQVKGAAVSGAGERAL